MHEQRAHIDIAAFADRAQVTPVPGAVLAWREPQPDGQVPTGAKVLRCAGTGHQGRGTEQPDARYLHEPLHRLALRGDRFELALNEGDALLEGWISPRQTLIIHRQGGGLDRGICAGRQQDAVLAPEAPQGIDSRGAATHPLRAYSMQRLHGLLLGAFDRHAQNLGIAGRLEDCLAVGPIGLVAPAIGADVLRRQQPHGEAQFFAARAPNGAPCRKLP